MQHCKEAIDAAILLARRQFHQLMGRHHCQMYRLFPWTFPRASYGGYQGCRRVEIETGNLLTACPTWVCTAPEPFPLRRSMLEFRERWSHRLVTVGAPEVPDDDELGAYRGCGTDHVWRVIGPEEFLQDIGGLVARLGPDGEFAEELPWEWRPQEMPESLFLCRHEVRGD